MRHLTLLPALLLLAALAPAEEPASKLKKVPEVGTILHDLRDLLPEVEKKSDKPDEGIPAWSVRSGFLAIYAAYDLDHDGLLSHTEIVAVCTDLKAALREHYPDTFAQIDTDGDDQITYKEFKSYQSGHH
jgi:hypothetical protein